MADFLDPVFSHSVFLYADLLEERVQIDGSFSFQKVSTH